jgi:hypothetical protein
MGDGSTEESFFCAVRGIHGVGGKVVWVIEGRVTFLSSIEGASRVCLRSSCYR